MSIDQLFGNLFGNTYSTRYKVFYNLDGQSRAAIIKALDAHSAMVALLKSKGVPQNKISPNNLLSAHQGSESQEINIERWVRM